MRSINATSGGTVLPSIRRSSIFTGPLMRAGSIRFAVTKLVTRRPLYRDFLQDSGRARWRRRRFASLAISPFSSSSPFSDEFFCTARFWLARLVTLWAYMRIPRWSLETRCGIIIKNKSLLQMQSRTCSMYAIKLTYWASDYFRRVILSYIKLHTSIRQKIECFFIFKLFEKGKMIFQINLELLQVNMNFKL